MEIHITKITSLQIDLIKGNEYLADVEYLDKDSNVKYFSEILNAYQCSKLRNAIMSGKPIIFDPYKKTILDFDPRILI